MNLIHVFFRKVFHILPILKMWFFIIYNRIFFYLTGVRYGKCMRVHNAVYVFGNGKLIIGDSFTFSSGSGINPICKNIRGEFYTGRCGEIIIGNNVGISSACLWASKKINIGNNVSIGGDCVIIDTDAHPLDYHQRRNEYIKTISVEEYEKKVATSPISIEDDVWIGARCTILKGVTIGARSIIGAGSVVVKSIPPDSIAAGNPAKVIRCLL